MSMRAVTDPLSEVGARMNTRVAGTYLIERLLGVGGMGVVALALDERLDRHVAIKFVKPTMFAVPDAHARFLREARAMARLAHRNVLSVFASGDHGDTPYFVMEYIDGRTAEQWLTAEKTAPLPIDDVVGVIEQACTGVDAIHATGTVHRDLKPSNVLIDRKARVAVGDFGVARASEEEGSRILVGTAAYMAPEAAFGDGGVREEPRDVYALGCIAYELLTGRPPFVGETDMNVLTQHVIAAPDAPSVHRQDLSSRYDDVILRALAKEVADRYPTAGAFRDALVAEHRGTRDPDRILVVDDDDDWRQLVVSGLMKRFPHSHIDQFGNGSRALDAFRAKPYAAVLIDLEMPTMNGTELTSLLRQMETAKQTPIIVLTAAGGPSEWKHLSAIGADAFLVKPVDADDVELVIRRTLRTRRGGTVAPPKPAG